MTRKVVFLDRDGTINEEVNYLGDPTHLRLVPGAARAIAKLNRAHRAVVVISNQAGVARGYFTEEAVASVNTALQAELAKELARIDAFYVCPHHPDHTGACACRKPGVALFERAARELDLDLSSGWMVGDRLSDLEAGFRLGLRTILLLTGYGGETLRELPTPSGKTATFVCTTLVEAIDTILSEKP